jgi:hypothetical protein
VSRLAKESSEDARDALSELSSSLNKDVFSAEDRERCFALLAELKWIRSFDWRSNRSRLQRAIDLKTNLSKHEDSAEELRIARAEIKTSLQELVDGIRSMTPARPELLFRSGGKAATFDVCILTILNVELYAVLKALGTTDDNRRKLPNGSIYWCCVARPMAAAGAGRMAVVVTAERGASPFSPDGICGPGTTE